MVFSLIAAVCFFTACKSDPPYDRSTQLAIDRDSIAKFIKANNLTDIKETSQGLFYQVLKEGTGTRTAHLVDSLKIHYVGKLMSTQLYFDSTTNNVDTIATKFLLTDAIEGWQLGIPLIKEGGRIRLIVPSTLAYQNKSLSTLVKSNSILDFDIQFIKLITPDEFYIKNRTTLLTTYK